MNVFKLLRGRAAILGILALLIARGPARAAEPSWQDLLNQAERLSSEGRYAESAAAGQEALAAADKSLGPDAPESGDLLSSLGDIDESAGADERLPEIEKRLTAVRSKSFVVWCALGKLWHRDGRLAEAEDAFKKALALNPGDLDADYWLALVYDDMGRFEEEIPLLKKVIENKPDTFTSYSQLASAYSRLGRSGEAKKAFAQARKIDGRTSAAFIAEGYFFLHSGHPSQAQDAFESAIAVDTSSPFGFHHMGVFLASRQQYHEAEKYFRRALAIQEADPKTAGHDLLHTMKWLGDVVLAQGRYAETEAIYEQVLAKAPHDDIFQVSGLQSLAKLYASQGKTAQAEKTFNRAVAVCETPFKCDILYAGGALVDFGVFYLDQGRRVEAAAMAERAEKFCEGAPIGERFEVLRQLSVLYGKLGDVAKRRALHNRLLPLRRKMPFSHDLVWVEIGLADMSASEGGFHDSEEHYRQAIEILDHDGYWKEEAETFDLLASIDDKQGRFVEAQGARDRAKSLRTRQ